MRPMTVKRCLLASVVLASVSACGHHDPGIISGTAQPCTGAVTLSRGPAVQVSLMSGNRLVARQIVAGPAHRFMFRAAPGNYVVSAPANNPRHVRVKAGAQVTVTLTTTCT
jgi:hypothetical protein